MFCPECGVEGHGKFCVECGTRISSTTSREEDKQPEELTGDWTQEICYERLIRYPFVRDQLILAGRRRPNRISGEQLLKFYDTVASPEVSLEKLNVAMLPILERMGIKSGSQAEREFLAAPGRVLLAVLCGLAGGGYDIEDAEQMSDGCILTAFLPSTLITNRGQIIVTVMQSAENSDAEDADKPALPVKVHAAAKISGQFFDWGKSKRILAELIQGIASHKELAGYVQAPKVAIPPPLNHQPIVSNSGGPNAPQIDAPQSKASPPGMPEPKPVPGPREREPATPPPIRRDVA